MKQILLVVLACLACPALARDDFSRQTEVRAFIDDMATQHSFSRSALQRQFRQARPLPAVLRAIRPAADPGIRSWYTYRDRFVAPGRIALGRAFADKHRAALTRAEAEYGVPADIIVAIIGVETIYGRNVGRFQTFSALATLAFRYPPRAQLFRDELAALLLLAREQQRDPLGYRGSYAGALGLPQFLPSSERRWAVDYDGDGKIDLATSADDAIGSVARFLAEHGWEKGGPILHAAQAAGDGVQTLIDEGITPKHSAEDMRSLGVEAADAPAGPAALIDYVTPGAPTEYRLGYRNFYVLTRYNRSSFYATAVSDLAEAIAASRGEKPEM